MEEFEYVNSSEQDLRDEMNDHFEGLSTAIRVLNQHMIHTNQVLGSIMFGVTFLILAVLALMVIVVVF